MYVQTELFGKIQSLKAPLKTAAQRVAKASLNEIHDLFQQNIPELRQSNEGPNSRDRIYSLQVTFWTFLWQCLNPGASCREAVLKVMAWFVRMDKPSVSGDDAPYCQARKRLPDDLLERLLKESALTAERKANSQGYLHGREIFVVDGTTVQMPDTIENQRVYPQLSNQKRGCGFPMLKMVAIFSLSSGALVDWAYGNKHRHELSLFRRIWRRVKTNAIMVMDRGFSDFVTMAGFFIRGVDSVARYQQARRKDFRQGKHLCKNQRLITIQKPKAKTLTASKRLWRSLPDTLTLRLIRVRVNIKGFRSPEIILSTTLLDFKVFTAADIAGLYLRRWRVELFFRDIKTTMKMEMLRCKTPAMIKKEILMHLISYNLIRCMMAEASNTYAVPIDRISFKGTLDTLRQFSPLIPASNRKLRRELIEEMFRALAADMLPHRPNRVEPRAVKRRPKPYSLLNKPRHQMKVIPHRSRHCKNRGS